MAQLSHTSLWAPIALIRDRLYLLEVVPIWTALDSHFQGPDGTAEGIEDRKVRAVSSFTEALNLVQYHLFVDSSFSEPLISVDQRELIGQSTGCMVCFFLGS